MSNLAGVFSAVLSAVAWGVGDFAGGMAARRESPYRVLGVVSAAGLLALLAAGLLTREALPRPADVGWAVLGGAAGAVGIVALYRALAEGSAAVVSPTAAVVGAAIPVVVGAVLEGPPGGDRLLGIAVGLLGIWLVSRSAEGSSADARRDLSRAILAGVCFGAFFVSLGQVARGSLFLPLVVAKAAALAVSAVVLARQRGLSPLTWPRPWALAAGVLDAAGNVFYLIARQLSRLDVTAVLVSMYPALTVLLARSVLRQRVSRGQWAGIALCLLSVARIAV
ncbi:MAG: hypothetical protein A2Y93_07190 [Chloroflexi bacterium RBG_13_68_17]|nr:MAG: hypothetical protein A2Y93_07190 [Chloroflexi bacterium RBG_13_68_17]